MAERSSKHHETPPPVAAQGSALPLAPAPARAAARPRGAGRSKAAAAARPAPPPAPGATQRIVDAITTAIVERRLMPGTKLAEQPIADVFQVSRTLVRQALNQLSRDRLVTLEPARGAFVAQPSVDEARQVFEVRSMLETALVRQVCAAAAADRSVLDPLHVHLKAEAAAVARVDVAGRTRLLAEFHVVLARLGGNAVLEQLLADLLSRCSLIALMYQSAHSAEHSHAEHLAIVDAIVRGDARAATRLMQGHLGNVERNLQLHPRVADLAQLLQPE